MSDDLYERRDAARQERLGIGDERLGLRYPRARLSNVGAGDFADVKSLLRGAKLLAENNDVTFPQRQDLSAQDDVHKGLGYVEQDILLGRQQILTARLNGRFAALDAIFGVEAVEDRLRQDDFELTRYRVRHIIVRRAEE